MVANDDVNIQMIPEEILRMIEPPNMLPPPRKFKFKEQQPVVKKKKLHRFHVF